MNQSKCCLISLFVFSILLLGNAATAETVDLLNLSTYSEGAVFSPADNVIVGQEEQTGVPYVTGVDGEGMLKIPVNLTGDFDIFIKVNTYHEGFRRIYLTLSGETEYQVALGLEGSKNEDKDEHVILTAGKDKSYDDSGEGGWKNSNIANEITFKVVGTMAKVYLNGEVFSQKLSLKPGITYTLLRFGKLSSTDKLYELTLTSTSGGVVTPPTSNDFEAGYQVGIEQCQMDPASCGITMGSGEQLGIVEHLQAFYDFFFANRGVNFNYPGNLFVPYEYAPEWQMDETLGYTVYLRDSDGNSTAYFDIAFTPTPP